jgi:ribosomal protein S18 acetylase RimI-like enzyme
VATTIRLLGPMDAGAVTRAAPDVFDHTPEPVRVEEFLNDPRHHLVAALDGERIVGFVSAVHYVHPDKPAELFVNEVAVAPSHRGHRVGRALMMGMLDHARALGCRCAWVLTDAANVRALRLYRSAGGIEEPLPSILFEFDPQSRASADARSSRPVQGDASVVIREATAADHDAIWAIARAVIARGDTYVFESSTPRDEVLGYWLQPSHRCFVAEHEGAVVGTHVVKANHPGLGAHVANAAFMVADDARGHGVGHAMGEHALATARRLGFRAMQFNFVVSTNESAVRLWKRLGFIVVGTLPGAFRHRDKGFVDAYVMFRSLLDLG